MDLSGDTITIRLIAIIILLELSVLFPSSKVALTTVNKTRIGNLVESGNQSVAWVMKSREDQGEMLSTILTGNSVVNLSASFMLTVLATEVLRGRAAGAVTGILTLLVLIFGEITLKIIATLEVEENVLRFGHMIYILMVLLTPMTAAVSWMSFGVLELLNVDPNKRGDDMTEDELRTIVEVGYEKDAIESEEKEMINSASDLDDLVARDIIVPRIDTTFINMNADFDGLLEVFRQERYTRLLVYEEVTDNVVGIISTKDMLLIENRKHFSIGDRPRQPLYTFESKKLSEPTAGMRGTFNNVVTVLDEYGAMVNLTTLEDILGEVVGGIRDEYDGDEEGKLVILGEGQYLVEGVMKLDDLNHKLGLELASEGYDPVRGLIIDKLEHLSAQGEKMECGGVRLVVEQVDKNRINEIHLYFYSHSGKEEDWLIKSLHPGAIYDRIRHCDKKQMVLRY